MQNVGWQGNSRIRKFALGDMRAGEVFYLVGGFEPCRISEHEYPKGKRIDDERIRFWYWYTSATQGQARWYDRNAEVCPVDFARIIRRENRRKAKLSQERWQHEFDEEGSGK